MLSSMQKFKCISVQVFKQFMNDSESSTESLRKKISHSCDNFMFVFFFRFDEWKICKQR